MDLYYLENYFYKLILARQTPYTMNKFFFLSVFSFTLLISCSKDNNTENKPSYYLTFKLNNSPIKHNFPTYSSLKPNTGFPGSYDFQLSSNSDDHKNNIVFSIHKVGAINTGSYTTTDNSLIDVSYTVFNNALGIEKVYSAYTTGHPPTSFSVTLTEITTNSFKGTFSGVYIYNDDRTDSVIIKSGDFFVKRHN